MTDRQTQLAEYPLAFSRRIRDADIAVPCRIISGPSQWGQYKVATPGPYGEQIRYVKHLRRRDP